VRLLSFTIIALYAVLCGSLLDSTAYAETQEIKHDSNQPVNISANKLEADDKTGVFVFIGDVQAQQGEVFIYAQKMTVYYSKAASSSNSTKKQVDKVVAQQDVRIVQLDRVATGQQAVYYNQEGRIVLTGDPRVVQGDNNVAGERIVVYLNDNRSVVEGGEKQRVKAVFVPEGQQ